MLMLNIYVLEEGNRNFVTLSSDDEGGMVGLELDCCTTGEIIGLVVIIAIFVGIPSFLVFRKLWKFGKQILFARIKEEYKENENFEVDELLGDSTKARNALGWESTISFNELVQEMVNGE